MEKREFEKECRACGTDYKFEAYLEDIRDWCDGKAIQHALPYLSPDIRELLLTGLCGNCFDNLVGEDDE